MLTSKDSYYYFNVFGEYGQVSYASQANMEYRSEPDATFSPDGRQTALFIYETIVIQETGTGKIIKTISVPDIGDFIENGIKIAYSSDSKKIITTAGIFDVESGEKLNNQGFPQFQLSSNGQTLAFSARKKNKDDRGVWLMEDAGVELWNVAQDQPINVLPGIYNARYKVSFNNAGTQIAFFDEYGNILVHEIQTGKLLHQFPFSADVFSLAFGPKTERSTGSLLAVGEDAGKISVWDTGNRQLINTFIGHPNNPVAISPDGQLLAHHSQNGDTVQIVDIFSGKVLRNLSGFDYWVNKIMFSPNGEVLAVNSTNMRELTFWDIRSGKKMKTTIGSGAFRFLQTTNQIVRIHARTIQILDIKSDETVLELDGEYWYSDVASSFDGRFIAAARDPLIDIWDAATKKMLRSLEGHPVLDGYDSEPTGQVENIMFHPFNYVLVSSDIHNTIIIWDVDTGKRIQTICGSKPTYSQDGRIFAYAGCDSRVYLLGLPSIEK